MISIQGPSNPKYKISLCKKFETGKGCPYGDRCQFAHGEQELHLYSSQNMMNMYNLNQSNKSQNSLLNYKIVKCKNWEKDKTCKYGTHCTFAHGDEELRNKTDNLYQFNPSLSFMLPGMIPQQGMDMAQMHQLMVNNQLEMGMNIINPNGEQFQNNNDTNNEKKRINYIIYKL